MNCTTTVHAARHRSSRVESSRVESNRIESNRIESRRCPIDSSDMQPPPPLSQARPEPASTLASRRRPFAVSGPTSAPVILQIGSVFTCVGLGGEVDPRCIVRTPKSIVKPFIDIDIGIDIESDENRSNATQTAAQSDAHAGACAGACAGASRSTVGSAHTPTPNRDYCTSMHRSLFDFLSRLLLSYAILPVKDRRVVIVESAFMTDHLKLCLYAVLHGMQSSHIAFVLTVHAAAMTSTSRSSLIVECGFNECISTCIVDGHSLMQMNGVAVKSIGMRHVHHELCRRLMADHQSFNLSNDEWSHVLRPAILDDIIARCCWVHPDPINQRKDAASGEDINYVVKTDRPIGWKAKQTIDEYVAQQSAAKATAATATTPASSLSSSSSSAASFLPPPVPSIQLSISASIRQTLFDVLFDSNDEQINIAHSIVSTLLSLNDAVSAVGVLRHTVLAGGVCCARGFRQRLWNEFHLAIKSQPALASLTGQLRFVSQSMSSPATVAWTGASILSVSNVPSTVLPVSMAYAYADRASQSKTRLTPDSIDQEFWITRDVIQTLYVKQWNQMMHRESKGQTPVLHLSDWARPKVSPTLDDSNQSNQDLDETQEQMVF